MYMQYDISVITPTYNTADYIEETLATIENQTFGGTVEILLIDDCSTDNTVEVIEMYQQKHPDKAIRLLRQEKNMRQGTARNRGMREANGTYIFFLDADDLLDVTAFEKLYQKAEEDRCDFVVCDWMYYYKEKGFVYPNNDVFMAEDLLENEQCERVLEAVTYFTVNKLYRRDFLVDNAITYGEGYIYEDYEFYVDVAQKANRVGILQNPLYHVRINEQSTTKSNRKTTLHIDSLVQAVTATMGKFNPRWEESYYYLYHYIFKKTLNYLRERAPVGYKKSTLQKVLNLLNEKNNTYVIPKNISPVYRIYFGKRLVQEEKVNQIIAIDNLYNIKKIKRLAGIGLQMTKSVKKGTFVETTNQKITNFKYKKRMQKNQQVPLAKELVLFLGFDYRFAGNSKYLFDSLLRSEENHYRLVFATEDEQVSAAHRVQPNSDDFYALLAVAEVVIAESWIPQKLPKRAGQKWIQLWHGTPFKRMLFDSHERHITLQNKNHKRNKQKDIRRWDYLLADSTIGLEKFISSFAMEEEKILNVGYPRVQWLLDNKENEPLKETIRQKIGVPKEKKVLLYVPTWRDYNYKTDEYDFDYGLDVERIAEALKDDYIILDKQHEMSTNKPKAASVYTPDKAIETQELILIADMVISDYSSIIFDSMAIGVPHYLFIKDFEKYEEVRGVYKDMHEALSPFYVDNEKDLIDKIQAYPAFYPTEIYRELQPTYTHTHTENANHVLEKLIASLLNE